MTHKEEMEYLKKHDPILYSELTSDPTHGSTDSGCGLIFGIALVIIAIVITILNM